MTQITAGASKEELPQDVDTLQQMVLTLLSQIDDLNGQLLYLKRQLFGKKSEKLNPAQRLLFENLYSEVQAKLEEQPTGTSRKSVGVFGRHRKVAERVKQGDFADFRVSEPPRQIGYESRAPVHGLDHAA